MGFTVPFPGNLYGALRLAARVKQTRPGTLTSMGGGYPNTELRQIREPRFFDYIDFLTLDDGEGPWLRLLEAMSCQLSVPAVRLLPWSNASARLTRDELTTLRQLTTMPPDQLTN